MVAFAFGTTHTINNLAHALIDILELPVFGSEENAANLCRRLYNLPERQRVRRKPYDENNDFYAFHSTQRKKITIWTNYSDELYRDAPK